MTDKERIKALSEILDSYCPSGIQFSMVNGKHASDNPTVKDYVLALADGLKYGNWPWVNYSKNPNQKFKV